MANVRVVLPGSCDGVMIGLRMYGVSLFERAFDPTPYINEALALPFVERPKEYGARKVSQEVSSCRVADGSALWKLGDAVECEVGRFFGDQMFESPLRFTNRNIQRYAHGTGGIGAHRDESSNRNLIVLCGLQGTGRLKVYYDLGCHLRTMLTIAPGSICVMVAPGFGGRDVRPVHAVDQICGDRLLLGLRQTERGKV